MRRQVYELLGTEGGGSDFSRPAPRGGGVGGAAGGAAAGAARGEQRSLFLKRGRIPRDASALAAESPAHSHNALVQLDGALPSGDASYLGLDDLRCGEEVVLVGVRVRVRCCEPSSRALLLGELGVEEERLGEDLEEW